jgi:hypothetical protein
MYFLKEMLSDDLQIRNQRNGLDKTIVPIFMYRIIQPFHPHQHSVWQKTTREMVFRQDPIYSEISHIIKLFSDKLE